MPDLGGLPKIQREYYNYLISDFMCVDDIYRLNGKSKQGIQEVVNKLKSNGYIRYLSGAFSRGLSGGACYTDPTDEGYRMHAQGFTIQILENSEKYRSRLKFYNRDSIKGVTVQFFDDRIMWHAKECDIVGKTVDECLFNAELFWNRFIVILENRYKIILIKQDKLLLNEFRGHVARLNDPLAKNVLKKGESLKARCLDGKIAFLVDFSHKTAELEAVHPQKNKLHIKKAEKFYEQLSEDDYKFPQEINSELKTHGQGLKETEGVLWKVSEIIERKVGSDSKNHDELLLMIKALTLNIQTLVTKVEDIERRHI